MRVSKVGLARRKVGCSEDVRVAVDTIDYDCPLHTASVVVWDADTGRIEFLVVSVELLNLYVHAPTFEYEPVALFLSESDLLWGHGSRKFDVGRCWPRRERPSQRWEIELVLEHSRQYMLGRVHACLLAHECMSTLPDLCMELRTVNVHDLTSACSPLRPTRHPLARQGRTPAEHGRPSVQASSGRSGRRGRHAASTQ